MKYTILNHYGLTGINAETYNPPEKIPNPKVGAGYARQTQEPAQPEVLRSYLGTPIFSSLNLYYLPGAAKGNARQLKELVAPVILETVLFDISMTRQVIETPMQGRDGTNKEYVADGDFQITVRGIIAGQTSEAYPLAEVVNLVRICEVPYQVGVLSPFLNTFNIFEIIIKSYSLPMTEGAQNVQHFDLTCISEPPQETTLL